MADIDIESPSKRFEEHIQIEKNYRIIFSGKFGTGKTYFLNKFFEDRKDIYNKFLISPVNYVVSQNEDIFELIKCDIIKDLFLTGKINLQKLPEDKTLQKISNFIEDKSKVVGNFMLDTLAKMNPSLEIPKAVIDGLAKIYKAPSKYFKPKKPEEKTISEESAEYLEETNEKIGHIYEHNYITKVINVLLEEQKLQGKKNVLIIDDFDRIDPEHIFRILNILSVHNNQFDEENKFKFDYIVLVCDIENIQKNFEHRYGVGVDFDGYIDKFFSTEIYYFTNEDAVKNYVSATFRSELDLPELELIVIVLQYLISYEALTLRKLLKHKYDVSIPLFVLFEQNGLKESAPYLQQQPKFLGGTKRFFVESDDLPILKFFKLMSFVYGSFKKFQTHLNHLKSLRIKATLNYKDCKGLISFLALQNHISVQIGDDLFFKKYYDVDHRDELVNLTSPITTLFQKEFQIQLAWNANKRYDSTESYFKDAIAFDSRANTIYSDTQPQIEISDIFDVLTKIVDSCIENNYLKKAEIHVQ